MIFNTSEEMELVIQRILTRNIQFRYQAGDISDQITKLSPELRT